MGSASGPWGEPGGEAGGRPWGGRGPGCLCISRAGGSSYPSPPRPPTPTPPPTAGERSVQKTGLQDHGLGRSWDHTAPPPRPSPLASSLSRHFWGHSAGQARTRGKGGRAASPSSTHTTALGPSGAWEKPSIEKRNKTSKDFALPAHSAPGSPLSRPEEPSSSVRRLMCPLSPRYNESS